jgi:hypothetical protein
MEKVRRRAVDAARHTFRRIVSPGKTGCLGL